MEPGTEFNYAGDAERVTDGSQVQVDGLFRLIEERNDEGTARWLVEDARPLDHPEGTDAELHRYLVTPAIAGEPEQGADEGRTDT